MTPIINDLVQPHFGGNYKRRGLLRSSLISQYKNTLRELESTARKLIIHRTYIEINTGEIIILMKIQTENKDFFLKPSLIQNIWGNTNRQM